MRHCRLKSKQASLANKSATELRTTEGIYRVTISDSNWHVIKVHCQFVLTDSILYMSNNGADHLPDGYAHYVRNLLVTNAVGDTVRFEKLSAAKWIIRWL